MTESNRDQPLTVGVLQGLLAAQEQRTLKTVEGMLERQEQRILKKVEVIVGDAVGEIVGDLMVHIDKRFNKLEKRFDKLEKRVGKIETKHNIDTRKVVAVTERVDNHSGRLRALEKPLTAAT